MGGRGEGQRKIIPPGIFAMSGDIFRCHIMGKEVRLASSGQRPGMLLKFLYGAGRPP